MNKIYSHLLQEDTIRKLQVLKLEELIDLIDEVGSEAEYADLSFIDKVEQILRRLYQAKLNQRIQVLRNNAKLRDKNAAILNITYPKERCLSRELMVELSTCNFMHGNTNIIFEGPTGAGKTYLACALGNAAMEKCFRCKYMRLPDLLQEYEEVKERHSVKNFIKKYVTPSLLILDEWLLRPISDEFCGKILDIIDARYGENSTIFCSQFPHSDWLERLGGTVAAEALIDRIVQNSLTVTLGDLNMRAEVNKRKF